MKPAMKRGLHRVNHESTTARRAPRCGERAPRLDRANLPRGKRKEPHRSGEIATKRSLLHEALPVEAKQLAELGLRVLPKVD